jgi:hypothetical protein
LFRHGQLTIGAAGGRCKARWWCSALRSRGSASMSASDAPRPARWERTWKPLALASGGRVQRPEICTCTLPAPTPNRDYYYYYCYYYCYIHTKVLSTPPSPPPSTFHRPPSTVRLPPSTFHRPPSTVHLPPSTVHRPPSTVHLPPSTFHRPPSTVHLPPSTVHRPPSTVHTTPPSSTTNTVAPSTRRQPATCSPSASQPRASILHLSTHRTTASPHHRITASPHSAATWRATMATAQAASPPHGMSQPQHHHRPQH